MQDSAKLHHSVTSSIDDEVPSTDPRSATRVDVVAFPPTLGCGDDILESIDQTRYILYRLLLTPFCQSKIVDVAVSSCANRESLKLMAKLSGATFC